METKQILKDIGKRCQGDIYLGIVGPVRSGKSTFIKRFMEMAVIPYIEDPDVKIRTIDELPQSGKGKMIMTVEPKFIPNQAVKIDLQDDFKINVRLVDCVGYVIEGQVVIKMTVGYVLLKHHGIMKVYLLIKQLKLEQKRLFKIIQRLESLLLVMVVF